MSCDQIRCDYRISLKDPVSALDLARVKNYLKIDLGQTQDDDLILQLISAAASVFEAYTHQDLVFTIYDVKCTGFPNFINSFFGCRSDRDCISIRKAPLIILSEIRFFKDGDFILWPATEYNVNVGSEAAYPFVTPVKDWPITDCHPRPVEMDITVGLRTTPGAGANTIPLAIRVGLEQHIAAMYENRGDCMCDKGFSGGDQFAMKSLPAASRLIYSSKVHVAFSVESPGVPREGAGCPAHPSS